MRSGPVLTIVVPTFNEAGNAPELIARLRRTLDGIEWEAVFVDDDSPDGTAGLVRRMAAEDGRLRCIRRVGRRGLAGACIEGMLAASAPIVAVMDADLQHDETLLPGMLKAMQDGAELVVGTRYAGGGTSGDGLTAVRQAGSTVATQLARRLMGVTISDPMSGFFMTRRDIVDQAAPRLSSQGFKILLDLVVSAGRPLATVEIPYTFRERYAGSSKLDSLVALDYLGLLAAKTFGDWISVRFLMFVGVGLTGVAVHVLLLQTLLGVFGVRFGFGQIAATYVAMIWNFFLNNRLTYRDRRLSGWPMLRGLILFCIVCTVGAVANVGVAFWLYHRWGMALAAGAAGAIMGAIFNFTASSTLTWRGA